MKPANTTVSTDFLALYIEYTTVLINWVFFSHPPSIKIPTWPYLSARKLVT